jgi:hypothetical protein
MRRAVLAVVVVLAGVLGWAPAASAHTVSGAGPTNFRATITALTPAVPGVNARVVENGSRLAITNDSSTDLTVFGYDGEPYLRIGPSGVFENERSPSVSLNQSLTGSTVSANADATATPVWRQVSSGHTARWHDRRIRWVESSLPDDVRKSPGRTHVVVPEWSVDLRWGVQPVALTGSLSWLPGPSPVAWFVGVAVVAVAVVALALTGAWADVLAAAVAALVVVDAVHAAGIGFAFSGSVVHRLILVLGASYYSLVAWVLGGVAIWLLARRQPDGLFGAACTGLVIGLFGGIADATVLWRSQLPFALPHVIDRAIVVATMGLGAGLVVGSAAAALLNPAARRAPDVA